MFSCFSLSLTSWMRFSTLLRVSRNVRRCTISVGMYWPIGWEFVGLAEHTYNEHAQQVHGQDEHELDCELANVQSLVLIPVEQR